MKKLFLVLFFLSLKVQAVPNWYPVGKTDAKTVYMDKSKCEKIEKQECFNVFSKNRYTHSVSEIDDINSPIYREISESPVQISCQDIEDCKSKMGGVCDADEGSQPAITDDDSWLSFFGITDPYFVYCAKITSYKKIKALVLDSAKKAAIDAAKAAKKAQKDLEKSGDEALKTGQKIKATMVGMIKVKALPKAQRKQLRGDLKSIIEALNVGSIDIAIDEIKALPEDGTVVTAEAKALILKIAGDAGYSIE
jgi:hypothetical protein